MYVQKAVITYTMANSTSS